MSGASAQAEEASSIAAKSIAPALHDLLYRRPIFLLTPRDDQQCVIRQRSLQRERLARVRRGPSILNEVDLRASDPSEAVREAARLDWPLGAIDFRLIDCEGREVFGLGRRQGS